jgi:tetratricopeptide (TPR) repeat protein
MQSVNRKNFVIAAILGLMMFALSCGKQNSLAPVQASAADPKTQAAEDLIKLMPDSPKGYNSLASIYIKNARLSGDFSLNTRAEAAVDKALELDAADIQARKLKASLHLTFHRFAEALEMGKKLQQEFPKDAFVYGVLTDANVELGDYEAAVRAAQKMVDLKPNSSSYARVGHLRSLYGDTGGAIEAMKTAARTADPQDPEEQSWCLVQLGDEYWKCGKYVEAEKVYDEALAILPDFHLALAGKGRARAAQDDADGAAKYLTDAQNRVPNVETIILLGDIYTRQWLTEKADRQYDLAAAIEEKLGGDQKRLALLWADRETRTGEALAIAEREFSARKDIYTADVLAWCLYRKGKFAEAKNVIGQATKLKTKDARIWYHAGMIEKGLGNKQAAKKMLRAALALNPKFDLIQGEKAVEILKGLS